MLDLNLRVETRTKIIASPIFTATTLQLAIDSFVAANVTGLVQLSMPSLSNCPALSQLKEFQPEILCLDFLDVPLHSELAPLPSPPQIELFAMPKALKLEPLAGIGSPPGTVNLVNGITYVTTSGIVISHGFDFLLDVCEPGEPEYFWRVESSAEANHPVFSDGAGKRILFNTYGAIFLFNDGSTLIVARLEDLLSFTVRYSLPTNPNIPGSGLTQQSIKGFDPYQISVFLSKGNSMKVQDGTLADMFF